MTVFARHHGALHVESVSLEAIAEKFGTPCYVYSRAALEDGFRAFSEACGSRDTLICYAMKANSNLAILNLFARMGAGFDIVSGGELARVIAAGGDPRKVVFSGVGKSASEMRTALQAEILCFNVESGQELDRLSEVAQSMNRKAPVSLRVNPDVDAKTHPYISTGLKQNKFGIAHEDALALYHKASRLPGITVVGIDCHIGSQLTEITPFLAALDRILALVDELQRSGIRLKHIDLGGGLGIQYRNEQPPELKDYISRLFNRLGKRRISLLFEPGRVLVGNAGLLLTRVEYIKPGEAKNFAVVDAAMNDLIRPALYAAWHRIEAVRPRITPPTRYDIVGPICETGDFLGRNRRLALEQGDLLAIHSAGAYGMSMGSNYNSRPRAAEVMVDGDRAILIREREQVASLFAGEYLLPA
jgi:diaminopimelate decarboxylase